MPQIENNEDCDFVTTVSLRIDFKELTFKDTFRRERINARNSKPQCSCSNLRDLHPYYSVKDIAQGLMPSNTTTARFVMTDLKKVERAGQLCAPDADLKFEHPKEFRFWILSLAVLLSELCEGDHSSKLREAPPVYGLRPFKQGEVSKKNVCEEIRRLLSTPLNPSEKKEHGMGYIYILRSQLGSSTVGELKIGFSKYHPEHRAHEIASCYALPEVISHTPLLPHAKRFESIIHLELQAVRKIHSCRKCKGNHREWFTILHAESREIVTRWSKWMLQQPYVDGELTSKWKEHLASKDFGSVDEDVSLPDLWQSIIDDFPQNNLSGAESERVGAYLSQCHWDITCARMGVDELEKVGCDKCQNYASKWRNFKKYPFPTSEDEINEATQRLNGLGISKDEQRGIWTSTYESCDCGKDSDPGFGPMPSNLSKKRLHPDEPIGSWASKNTRLGRMCHPAMPHRHLIMPDRSPGPLSQLIQSQAEEEKSAHAKLFNHLASLKGIKTGARSVGDPCLGRTESPLGDATLLPVLSLKDLKCVDSPVISWVGYTPTHSGFQFLQEAYKEGKWFGRKPQFKLPKAYRAAGVDKIPMPDRKSEATSDEDMNDASNGNASMGFEDIDRIMRSRKKPGPTFSLSRRSDYGTESFTFTQPMDDEFNEQLRQMVEVCKIPAGREMVQRECIRSMRQVGLDACFGLPDIGDESDSDGEIFTPSPPRSSTSLPTVPAKRAVDPNAEGSGINRKRAKQWLENM